MTHGQLTTWHARWWLPALVTYQVACATGCQQKMAEQPSARPLEPSEFFADGQSARPPIPGTVARGHLHLDHAYYQGLADKSTTPSMVASETESTATASANASSSEQSATTSTAAGFAEDRNFVDEFPLPISQALIEHGRNRYMIYCVICHDPLGTGAGRVVERGYSKPPSYHIARLRQAPVGRLFAVVSEGYGSMPSYTKQISPEDRWAIVAYVKALQLSQHFPTDRLTPAMQAAFEKSLHASPETNKQTGDSDG